MKKRPIKENMKGNEDGWTSFLICTFSFSNLSTSLSFFYTKFTRISFVLIIFLSTVFFLFYSLVLLLLPHTSTEKQPLEGQTNTRTHCTRQEM